MINIFSSKKLLSISLCWIDLVWDNVTNVLFRGKSQALQPDSTKRSQICPCLIDSITQTVGPVPRLHLDLVHHGGVWTPVLLELDQVWGSSVEVHQQHLDTKETRESDH